MKTASRLLTHTLAAVALTASVIMPGMRSAAAADSSIVFQRGYVDEQYGFGGSLYMLNPATTDAAYFFGGGNHPNYSPDGSQIVFIDTNGDLTKTPANNYTPTNLVIAGGGSTLGGLKPKWSPDGTLIAFETTATNANKIVVTNAACTSGNEYNAAICNYTKLDESTPAVNSDPDWYPTMATNGTTRLGSLVFVRKATSGATQNDIYSTDISIDQNGVAHEIDTTNLTQSLSTYEAPSYSHDGSKIIFVENGSLHLMDSNGSNQHPIVGSTDSGLIYGFDPVFSKDDTKIIWGAGSIYSADLAINANGSVSANNIKELTNGSSDRSPSWTGTIVPAGGISLPLTTGASNKIDLGSFTAGTAITISFTGHGDLIDSRWAVTPDGSLAAVASSPYDFANPGAAYPKQDGGDGVNHYTGGGANYDASGSGYGFAGKLTTDTIDPATIRNGAVVGTFAANPSRADWFLIGNGTTIEVPPGGAHLFVAVNDSIQADNHGTYVGTLTTAADMPPVPPAHGGLSQTKFTVNGSSARAGTLTGPVLSFSAQQAGRPAELAVHVQFTRTPEPNDSTNTSWTDLPTSTGGRMTLDVLNNRFVLNTTDYPAQPGLFFRAVSSAPPYPDSISNYVGSFDASTAGNHLPPVVLLYKRQGTLADFSFKAGVKAAPSDVAVRIQSSTTPAVESSWMDLADGQSGQMTRSTNPNYPDVFLLLANNLPAADHAYFRAVAQKSGYLDSLSNAHGAETFIKDIPPTVTLHPPVHTGGSGTPDDPYIVPAGQIQFSADATPDPLRPPSKIISLRLEIDSKVITDEPGAPASVDYHYTAIGDHVLEAVAEDDLYATSRAATSAVYIRVIPSGTTASKAERVEESGTAGATTAGKVYTVVNSGGIFSDASTWKDAQGQNGVPGPNDVAVIGSASVRFSLDVTVQSLSINGGTLIGPGNVDVLGTMTVSAMSVDDYVGIFIHPGAVCELVNRADVRFNAGASGQKGKFYNNGTVNVHGSGGLIGLDQFSNTGTINWAAPIAIALNANSDPAADLRAVLANSCENTGVVIGFDPNSLISQDGAGIVSHDSGGLVAAGGGNIVSHDSGGIVSHDSGGIISHDGGGLIGQDGAGLVAAGGGNLVAAGGGNFSGGAPIRRQPNATSNSSDSGFVQTSGNTDLSAVTIIGPVTLNGGLLSGSGMILGDLTNNGGYISPGHSAGAITVLGSFNQGANGTLIVENGGAAPDSYDQLLVNGAATLGGTLDVKLINGYKPDAADTFNPIGYASVSGNFAAVSSNAHITANSTGLLVTSDAGAPNPASGQPKNISTRARVEAGDGVTIAGFIISGNASKKVLIRGLGPELVKYGVSNTLADPMLDLHKPGGEVISNDNWKQTQQADIEASGLAPHFDVEAAIVATLDPGEYTAILSGNNGGTGVGLVEVYDLEIGGAPKLVNISTRCMVQTGDNVLIGGVIIGGNEPAKVLVRAIGPSLAPYGVKDVLADPELELHDSNGGVIANGDWRETQEAEITATHMAPADDHEAAILATLVPGNYTAIVRGKDDTIGVALVEVYLLP